MIDNIHALLKKHWGYSAFRPKQEEVINAVIHGNDAFALMPTGAGKSICYQIPALIRPGICIVITPLIALMEDQVNQLKARDIRALSLNSSMSQREIDITLDNAAYGKFKFLYISPERLQTRLFKERLKKMNVSLIAVDEAHCISEWGYDFRPAYSKISALRELLPNVPLIALTATATPKVADDIQEKLLMKNSFFAATPFERNNISYTTFNSTNKHKDALTFLKRYPKSSGIVYADTRKKVKELYDFFYSNGISCSHYHGGLKQKERKEKQAKWMANETNVIVSTNAFGMGIDKSDVRFVLHITPTENIESYFQEAGRAGRDGKPSTTLLFYNQTDLKSLEEKLEKSFPPLKFIKNVYRALASYFRLATGSGKEERFEFQLSDFCNHFNFNLFETYSAIKFLEYEGYIFLSDVGIRASKLKALVEPKTLYSEQVKHEVTNRLVALILRSSIGIFNDYISLNENKLAQKLNISLADVNQVLKRLHQREIIDYLPTNNNPELLFLTEVFNTKNLRIAPENYAHRKALKKSKLDAFSALVTGKECIQKGIIEYFGSKSENCGRCSSCKSLTKHFKTPNDLLSKLKNNNLTHQFSIEELSNGLTNEERDSLIENIRLLEESNHIHVSDTGLHFKLK